jgi:hypothetical protein
MSLSNDVVVLVMDAFEAELSGDFTFTMAYRTSPPNDLVHEIPCAVFRNIAEVEQIRNVHGTKFRDTADVWVHIIGKTKAQVTEIKDLFKAAHRAIWKVPGNGMKHILWENVTNNDHEDAHPQIFERIIKLKVMWEDT